MIDFAQRRALLNDMIRWLDRENETVFKDCAKWLAIELDTTKLENADLRMRLETKKAALT